MKVEVYYNNSKDSSETITEVKKVVIVNGEIRIQHWDNEVFRRNANTEKIVITNE